MRSCDNCGEEMNDNQKFCMKCGCKVEMPSTQAQIPVQAVAKPWQPNQKPTLSKDLNNGTAQYMSFPEARKTVTTSKKWKIIVAILLVICVGTGSIIGLSSLFKEKNSYTKREKSFEQDSSDHKMTEKGEYKVDKELVTEENPVIKINDITIDFGSFNISGSEEVVVTKAPIQEFEEGLRIYAYNIELGDRTEFSDVITISLPYDPTYIESGFEEESVAGKYFNEETKGYESIPYTIDTQKKLVNITTTHLSTYSVFQVNNPYSRAAHISGSNIDQLSMADADAIMREYIESGGNPGELALESGYKLFAESLNLTSKTNTLLTAGGNYDSNFCEKIDKSTRWLGLLTACVNLAVGYSTAETDEDTRRYVTNAYKDVMYSGVDFLGSSAMQVGFVAVFVVDYRLNQFMTATIEQKQAEFREVYNYYNKKFMPMTSVQWYQKFENIYKNNKNDINKTKQLIDDEINKYVDKFWTLDQDTLWMDVMADTRFKRMPYPNPDDIVKLKAECKENLMQELTAVFTRLEMYLIQQIKAEYYKQFDELKKELNTIVQVKIVDDEVSGDEVSQYAGYTVQFGPLSSQVNPKNWTGVMKDEGVIQTKFTVLGHMQSGLPNEVRLYKPGDNPDTDEPEQTIKFKVKMPETVIVIGEKELDATFFTGRWSITYEGKKGTLGINIIDNQNCTVSMDSEITTATTYSFDPKTQTIIFAPQDRLKEEGYTFSGVTLKRLERTDVDAIQVVGQPEFVFTRPKQ